MPEIEAPVAPIADLATTPSDPVTEEGRLRGGRCGDCSASSFPRAEVCPRCNGTRIAAAELPGDGSLYTWTTVHISPTFATPYTLGYVDLSDGLRILTQVLADPQSLKCDAAVRLTRSADSPTGWGVVPVEGASA